jgi:CheY-like chemotaxis protein
MSKTILCADDSKTMQQVAEITFRATDYEYVGATSADDALAKAKGNKPALILADAVMPGKTGYDLCQAVKNDPALAGVPVMMMCGNSQPYDDAKGAAVGCDGHVTKPWDTQVMIDKVEELLSKSGGAAASTAAAAPAPAKPAAPPAKPAAPKPPAPPATPAAGAARTATIMGMPTIQMPGGKPAIPGVTPVTPPSQVAPATPKVPDVPKVPTVPKVTPPAPAPVAKSPAPAPTPAPKPAAPAPAPVAAKPAAAPAGGSRPPMIAATPTKKPSFPLRNIQDLPRAMASAIAAGLDPTGPEMQALLKISHEVVERIVWEVVPELAEIIIKENLDSLSKKAG